MKKIKQNLALFALVLLIISCSNGSSGDSSNSSVSSTIIGKWAFGPVLSGCNTRNSIEFKNTNVYYEHHYSGNCQLTSYPGSYTKNGDILMIDGNENVILELTTSKLKLFDKNDNETEIYDKVN